MNHPVDQTESQTDNQHDQTQQTQQTDGWIKGKAVIVRTDSKLIGHFVTSTQQFPFTCNLSLNPPLTNDCCPKERFWDFKFNNGSFIDNVQEHSKGDYFELESDQLLFESEKIRIEEDANEFCQKVYGLDVDDVVVGFGRMEISKSKMGLCSGQ